MNKILKGGKFKNAFFVQTKRGNETLLYGKFTKSKKNVCSSCGKLTKNLPNKYGDVLCEDCSGRLNF